jgi:hypothetical protein
MARRELRDDQRVIPRSLCYEESPAEMRAAHRILDERRTRGSTGLRPPLLPLPARSLLTAIHREGARLTDLSTNGLLHPHLPEGNVPHYLPAKKSPSFHRY